MNLYSGQIFCLLGHNGAGCIRGRLLERERQRERERTPEQEGESEKRKNERQSEIAICKQLSRGACHWAMSRPSRDRLGLLA